MNRNKEDERFWNDLIYDVCKGDVANMRELRRLDVFGFFAYLEKYELNARSRTTDKGRR